jgi:hypothetical protein
MLGLVATEHCRSRGTPQRTVGQDKIVAFHGVRLQLNPREARGIGWRPESAGPTQNIERHVRTAGQIEERGHISRELLGAMRGRQARCCSDDAMARG